MNGQEKRGPGAASKLTPEREQAIVDALRHGATWKAAAAAAGISESTVHLWRDRGETEESGRHSEFVERCTRAVAEGEAAAVQAVYLSFTQPTITRTEKITTSPDGSEHRELSERTDPPDAMMALRWLERRAPAGWSPKTITEHLGAVPVAEQGPREVRITLVQPDGAEATATRGDGDGEKAE